MCMRHRSKSFWKSATLEAKRHRSIIIYFFFTIFSSISNSGNAAVKKWIDSLLFFFFRHRIYVIQNRINARARVARDSSRINVNDRFHRCRCETLADCKLLSTPARFVFGCLVFERWRWRFLSRCAVSLWRYRREISFREYEDLNKNTRVHARLFTIIREKRT